MGTGSRTPARRAAAGTPGVREVANTGTEIGCLPVATCVVEIRISAMSIGVGTLLGKHLPQSHPLERAPCYNLTRGAAGFLRGLTSGNGTVLFHNAFRVRPGISQAQPLYRRVVCIS